MRGAIACMIGTGLPQIERKVAADLVDPFAVEGTARSEQARACLHHIEPGALDHPSSEPGKADRIVFLGGGAPRGFADPESGSPRRDLGIGEPRALDGVMARILAKRADGLGE